MHLLHSLSIGADVIDDTDHQVIGKVMRILFDADRAKVVGLLVYHLDSGEVGALQTQDILSWGRRIHVREAAVVGPMEDFLRLRPFLEDERSIVGQRIQTKSGRVIGRCADVQFRTNTFDLEWIFPRKFFFFRVPALPVNEILEITSAAIIIRDQGPRAEKASGEQVSEIPSLPHSVISPATRCRKPKGNVG